MFPLAFTILWKKQSAAAATIAPLLGLVGAFFSIDTGAES